MIALDTNVLVYAHRREPREHAAAVEKLLTRHRDFSLFPELSTENPFG